MGSIVIRGMLNMLLHKGTVEIKTERLILRKFIETDAQAMFDN